MFLCAAEIGFFNAAAQTKTAHTTTPQHPARDTQKDEDPGWTELNQRIHAADAARAAGNPGEIVNQNKLLIAEGLRLMAALRLAESAYPQAAQLYRSSLEFETVPGIDAQLALSLQLAGQQDEAIAEAQKALISTPNDPRIYITLGHAYLAKGDFDQGAKALMHAYQIHPSMDILYSLAVCWLSSNKPDAKQRADAVFAEMKAVAGDSGSLHVLIGRAYRDAGLMQDAVREFKRAIELDTTTPHAHYFLGLASLAVNDWQPTPETQAEMEKEVQYHPQDYLANYMLGFLASSKRQYAIADKYLQTAIGLNSTWPEPYLFLGLNAYAQGDDKTAETMLRKAVELTGKDESRNNYQIRRAYVDLARILAREGNEKESDEFVAKARDLENKVMTTTQQQATALILSEGGKSNNMAAFVPLDKQQENQAAPIGKGDGNLSTHVDASTLENSNLTASQRDSAEKEEDMLRPILGQSYSDLATAEAIQQNYQDALTYYQTAEQWDPDISDLEKNLGQAAFRAENYTEAVHGLSQAVKQNPDAIALRAMLGMAYFETQKYGDAATAFYPLGEDGMRDPTVGYAWAASLAKVGDLKHATEVLETYQSGQLSNQGLLLVGQLWVEIGDYDRAASTFRQILASDPSYPKAHYNIALADIQAEKWEDARDELNAELAISPGDPDTMYNLGFVDLQESKNDDAKNLFEQVIAKRPDYANAQYELGKLLLDSGQIQDSLPHLEAAARISPDKDYVHYQLQAAYRKLSRTADADRELALYQELKAKSRAQAQAQIEQQNQQKP